jgi:SAM-dependent methyltransferase
MTSAPSGRSPAAGSAPDWGVGRYEHTAAQLLPVARVVVEHASPERGERVVDVGCGTGNAALLAAQRGAATTGVDAAPRLLEVARARAAAQGLDAVFARGDAAALPIDDGGADVVLSVFGVIFAADPRAAAAEVARVTTAAGRIVLSAWLPEGAISEVARFAGQAVARALGTPPGPPPFPWHDRRALNDLFGPHGLGVTTEEFSIAFTAGSPGEYLDGDFSNHPLAVAARAVLEPRGEAEALRDHLLAIYEAANEDPDAFRITSRYVVATARRGG